MERLITLQMMWTSKPWKIDVNWIFEDAQEELMNDKIVDAILLHQLVANRYLVTLR